MKWNPEQYLKFQSERTQPSMDLANRLMESTPKTVLDVGCGPGNSTEILARYFPSAKILGVDNSPEMIEAAKKSLPQCSFAVCDISNAEEFSGEKFDLIFSNACLQWVPNHETLLPKLFGMLSEGGTLAVQIPVNKLESIHLVIAELVNSRKWAEKIPQKRIFYNLPEDDYFDILSSLSEKFSIWKTVYFHEMNSHNDLLEWHKGTGLRPYLAQLSAGDAKEFEADFLAMAEKAYPARKSGKVIFRFPRLFFTATRQKA